jgi:hypothetical protein
MKKIHDLKLDERNMCVCANVFWYVQISVGFWCQIPTRYQGKYIDS